MAEHKPIYRDSFDEARRHDELDAWRESRDANIRCRDFVADSISRNHDGLRLGGDTAGDIIEEFGYDRTMHVLANTIRLKDYDGRISAANKEWAKGFSFTDDLNHRWDFALDHPNPGLVDMVTNHVRRAYEQLGLFDMKQCDSIYDFDDLAGRVLVLKPEVLKDEYKTPESQLFKAERGFGCNPRASGRAVFGTFMVDGEQARFSRQDFLGVIKPEHMPAWAVEKMAEPESEQTQDPMHIKVYQINHDRDLEHRCFESLQPGQHIDASIYDMVYDGPVPSTDPEAIFQQFNVHVPPLHRGENMSISDVIEVEGKHLFVDTFGFPEVDFDASLTQKPDDLLRVVVVEPGLPAYEGEIGPDLKSMQRAVGGLIEVTYPFEDNAVILGNEEAKLINMEGNRHIGGQVYAGPLYIVGDDGEGGFCSLTDAQAVAYCQEFTQAEEITQEEVQADMGFTVYGFN